jgi:hypothetical protein
MSVQPVTTSESRPTRPVLRSVPAPTRSAAGRNVLVQILLVGLAVVAYLAVRTFTAGDVPTAEANAHDVMAFERSLGLDWERGAQAMVLDSAGVVRAFNAIYIWCFWPVVAGALVVLYRLDRRRYTILRNALFLSGAVGLVVFALFPVAPPRFLDGFVDTIQTMSGQNGVAHPSSFANEYAAMPSFHVGWSVLAGVVLSGVIRHRVLRWLALVPGVLMAATVVVTANHYVLDALAGVVVSLSALAGARAIQRSVERRRSPVADGARAPVLCPAPALVRVDGRVVRLPRSEGWDVWGGCSDQRGDHPRAS